MAKRKTAHQKKSKRIYCESTSNNNFSNHKSLHNLSINSQLNQGESSPETRHRHKRPRKRNLKANDFIVGKPATANKKADPDTVTNTIKEDAIKPQKRPAGNQSITRKLYAKYAVKYDTRQRIAIN